VATTAGHKNFSCDSSPVLSGHPIVVYITFCLSANRMRYYCCFPAVGSAVCAEQRKTKVRESHTESWTTSEPYFEGLSV